ncbi:MAG: SprT-like domain-containing protein [Xanthomonadaceae bacterium]|nr:SprT-like domain-containing protein [Xanthomonadaceae bacterium]
MPLTSTQQQEIRDLTAARIEEAARLYRKSFAPIPVQFDLRGRAAGQFRFRCQGRQREYTIRYNPWVFAADLAHHQSDTVAHEVAHYIVHLLHPGAKPHGREWKALMRQFGATPKACTPYDLTGVPTRQQARHVYRCACPGLLHSLSTTRHRRIQQGTRYLCRSCKSSLQNFGVRSCNPTSQETGGPE